MKISDKLLYAFVGAAMMPGSIVAQEETREINRPLTVEKPMHVNIKRAPSNASYQTTLVGFMYYANSWNELETTTPIGIYTIGVQPGDQPEPFARIGMANSLCNGGAVLAGDTYWYIWRQTDPTGSTGIDISQLYSYNILTGEFQAYGAVESSLASVADKAWDPTEDKIYGQYTLDNTRQLCIIDYEKQEISPIGNCFTYYGLAFDGNGQLWGIDSAGDLYKVDKKSGLGTKIGNTGVVPNYSQSMAFDFKTGDLYWASYTSAGAASSNLYKVDTVTAKLTLITAFKDQEEFLGLGVMPSLCPDNAPGYVTDLSVTMSGASTSGNISFVLPCYTYLGDDLDGDISYKVSANGNLLFEGKGKKGESVNRDILLPLGDVSVSVVCANSEGNGPDAIMQQWVGEDYPLSPANVRLTVDENLGRFSLSWDAVTEGVHGGYIDPEKITYTITRFPDNTEVATNQKATSFVENLDQPQLPEDYYYLVKTFNDWRESPESAESNHVPYGKGFEVPYTNRFDDASSLDLFYTIDGNGDGYTWNWSRFGSLSAYIFTGTDNPKPQDDWLITPGIDMKAGNRYEVSYIIPKNMNNGKFFDMLQTAFGVGVDPSSYTIAEDTFICKIGADEKRTVVISPQTDGYYHFGFHAVSDCVKGLSIAIDDLHIDVLPNEGAPASVSNLSLKASQGTAPVTIKFTTPTKDNKGNKLENITKIDIFRNTSELVKTIESPAPGKQLSIADNKGARGLTKYTVVAYNDKGVGERAEKEIFLGLDIPGAPEDIKLVDIGNGRLSLSWNGPKEGVHGGYCDASNLTYNIYYLNNGYYSDFQKGVRNTEVTINAEDYYANEQSLICFAISAINSAGEGFPYQSSEVIIGNSYKYPYAESWIGGNAHYDMWYRMNSGQNGWLPEANFSSDKDGGCMAFDALQDGDMSYVCLGKVNMTSAGNPKLIFDYYAIPGSEMSITPEINLAFNGDYKVCDTIFFNSVNGDEGWREAVVDLAELKSLPYISVRFLGVGSSSNILRLDNVRIMDSDKVATLGYSGLEEAVFDPEIECIYYDVNGMIVSHPRKGSIYVIRSADGKAKKIVY